MRALVSGGAGFLGKHLVDRLSGAGWDVLVVDDYSTFENPPEFDTPKVTRARLQDVDPYDFPIFDVVMHLAGKLGPVGVLRYTGNIASDTINAAQSAARFAEYSHCPLIDISTSEVYGSPDAANSESTPSLFQPGHSARMEYAVSKRAAEIMLQNRKSLDVRIIRPFNISGSYQRPEGGFVIPRMVRQALDNESLTVYNPGTQRRAFTSVHDIVSGILLAFENGKTGEVYNLGRADNTCSILQLAEEIITAAAGGNIMMVDPMELHGEDFREAAEKIPDSTKAMRELGWVPTRTRAMIIEEVIDYERNRLGLGSRTV